MHILKMFFLLINLTSYNYNVHSQINCLVYESILDTLSTQRMMELEISKKYRLTDINEIGTLPVKEVITFNKFYIDKEKLQLEKNRAKVWFSQYINNKNECDFKYVRSEKNNCKFSNEIIYDFIDTPASTFSTLYPQVEFIGKDSTEYSSLRISFSEILYNENTALIWARCKYGGLGLVNFAYSFVLKKNEEQLIWQIIEMNRHKG